MTKKSLIFLLSFYLSYFIFLLLAPVSAPAYLMAAGVCLLTGWYKGLKGVVALLDGVPPLLLGRGVRLPAALAVTL